MRLFLIYFFSSKKFIKHGFLYSHFEIYSKDNTVSLNIFYYDRNLLLLFESFYETFTEGAAGLYLQEPIKFKYSDF